MPRTLPAFCLALAAVVAQAADRPYLYANSAAAEEDEEQVWSVENWYRQTGRQKSLTVAPEYAFDPDTSLQVEMRRTLGRGDGKVGGNGHEIEIEAKRLFNRIAREGWGWGVVAAIDMERPRGGPWERAAVALLVPLTLQIGQGEGLVHLNAGVAKPRGERRLFTGAIAAEREVWRRTALFAEVAREPEGRLLHAGVRHWIKRERLAVDLAWQRMRSDEVRGSGVVLGIAWYDL